MCDSETPDVDAYDDELADQVLITRMLARVCLPLGDIAGSYALQNGRQPYSVGLAGAVVIVA